MGNESSDFFKGSIIEEEVDTLAGGEFAFGVFFVDAGLAAAEVGEGEFLMEGIDH
jgi:hypothetical protein